MWFHIDNFYGFLWGRLLNCVSLASHKYWVCCRFMSHKRASLSRCVLLLGSPVETLLTRWLARLTVWATPISELSGDSILQREAVWHTPVFKPLTQPPPSALPKQDGPAFKLCPSPQPLTLITGLNFFPLRVKLQAGMQVCVWPPQSTPQGFLFFCWLWKCLGRQACPLQIIVVWLFSVFLLPFQPEASLRTAAPTLLILTLKGPENCAALCAFPRASLLTTLRGLGAQLCLTRTFFGCSGPLPRVQYSSNNIYHSKIKGRVRETH